MGSFQPKDKLETRLFINGEYVAAKSGRTFDIYNPATEELVTSVHEADAEDVDDAVKAAKEAFPGWEAAGAHTRAYFLNKLAEAIEKNGEELDYLEAVAMGKPVSDFCNSVFAAFALKYYAAKAIDVLGTSSLNSPGFVNMAWRQPFGVTGAIIPWNMSLVSFVNKIGPALATGNTIVLKSSEKCPLSITAVGRLAQEAGLPKGVLNILSGFGRPCGEAIAKHMEIRKVSFTGSQAAGRAIKKAAADSNLKNVTLELGGKSPLIVFPDADLDKTATAAAASILMLSGQACVSSTRIYAHEEIAQTFTEKLTEAIKKSGQTGDPLDKATTRGSQADKAQFERIMSYIKIARDDGLTVALGGKREDKKGYYIEPTVITNVAENHKLVKEEIFGPVLVLNTFINEEEVMKRANDTEFGLYSSVFTKDISRALRVAKKFEAGMCGINCTSPSFSIDLPFGGWKGSGEGREYSNFGFDVWTELKSVIISL